ncbi:MAG TPA: zf-TFIIB domain-containing protein [Candidatus Limnocylindria bacterium]|nr:zf-TFIIB domain-containing protein [Candidatus Limnocylindria bacterium]
MTRKPSESEEEYFARVEFERRKKIEKEKRQSLAGEEKKRLRDLHYMKCPKCGMDLIEVDYKSVRMDKCPGCEGVWLDLGELDAVAKMDKSMIDRIFGLFPG